MYRVLFRQFVVILAACSGSGVFADPGDDDPTPADRAYGFRYLLVTAESIW